MSKEVFDRETLQAIGELLALGKQHGFGITFVPDAEGWTVGYMRGMSGGDLITGYDLGDTCHATTRETGGPLRASSHGARGRPWRQLTTPTASRPRRLEPA